MSETKMSNVDVRNIVRNKCTSCNDCSELLSIKGTPLCDYCLCAPRFHDDNIEQYGRRLCLRVNDVPLTKDETSKEVEDKLKEEFITMGLNLPENAIDRAHQIGRKYQVQAQQESDDGNEAGVITKHTELFFIYFILLCYSNLNCLPIIILPIAVLTYWNPLSS